MAYIPPHKRQTGDTDKPDPTPALLAPQFRKNLSLGSSSSSFNKKNDRDKTMGWIMKIKYYQKKKQYANSFVYRWFAVGLTNDDVLPYPVSLQLVPSGNVKLKDGERLILVNTEVEKTTEVGSTLKSPWVIIAENVLPDLLSSFLAVRNEKENNDFVKVKPALALVARIGKIMFPRTSSVNIETGENNALPLSTLRNLRRTFYTNLPSSYLENITTGVAQEVGLEVEDEKERYRIQLYDKEQPDATILCKCKVTPDGQRLELLKIKLNPVRYACIDISCLTKKLDLRLDLYTITKRNITTFNDVEKHSIQDLVNSAVLDSNIKGGLRWPLGKDCSVDCRYIVVGVWHTNAQYFKNSNLRLRVQSEDRFDYRTSTGEFSWEVVLELSVMVSKMEESNVQTGSLLEALADSIKVIWNHFLHCDNYLSIDSTSS